MKNRIKLACLLGASVAAQAATNGFVIPGFRSHAGSHSGGWEVHRVGTNDGVGNLPDLPGNLTGATLVQLDPGAFVTGSGNIYNVGGISRFVLTHQAAEPLGWVTLQVRTLGAELDYGSVRLSYESGGSTLSLAPLDRIELDRGMQLGVNVSSRWDWDLDSLGITRYQIEFTAAGTSLSFDSAVLDTAAVGVVPEPSTTVILIAGAVLLAGHFTRRGT